MNNRSYIIDDDDYDAFPEPKGRNHRNRRSRKQDETNDLKADKKAKSKYKRESKPKGFKHRKRNDKWN